MSAKPSFVAQHVRSNIKKQTTEILPTANTEAYQIAFKS